MSTASRAAIRLSTYIVRFRLLEHERPVNDRSFQFKCTSTHLCPTTYDNNYSTLCQHTEHWEVVDLQGCEEAARCSYEASQSIRALLAMDRVLFLVLENDDRDVEIARLRLDVEILWVSMSWLSKRVTCEQLVGQGCVVIGRAASGSMAVVLHYCWSGDA